LLTKVDCEQLFDQLPLVDISAGVNSVITTVLQCSSEQKRLTESQLNEVRALRQFFSDINEKLDMSISNSEVVRELIEKQSEHISSAEQRVINLAQDAHHNETKAMIATQKLTQVIENQKVALVALRFVLERRFATLDHSIKLVAYKLEDSMQTVAISRGASTGLEITTRKKHPTQLEIPPGTAISEPSSLGVSQFVSTFFASLTASMTTAFIMTRTEKGHRNDGHSNYYEKSSRESCVSREEIASTSKDCTDMVTQFSEFLARSSKPKDNGSLLRKTCDNGSQLQGAWKKAFNLADEHNAERILITCCTCGDGLRLAVTTPVCIECQHCQCENCEVTEV
jgi:hypothetical protein